MSKYLVFIKKLSLVLSIFLSMSLFAGNQRCLDSLQEKKNQSSNDGPSEQVTLEVQRAYVEGVARGNKIVFLRGEDYRQSVQSDAIPVNSILVLDELPLIEDLPLVSGILINKNLSLEASHVQFLAEKLGIPLVTVESVFDHQALRTLSKTFSQFELSCRSHRCDLKASNEPFTQGSRLESVLPKKADRFSRDLFSIKDELTSSPREISGDKYFSLMQFKKQFNDLVPEITSLSSGYFESFLDRAHYEGVLLRVVRRQALKGIEEANARNDEDAIKNILANLRNAFLKAEPVRSWSRPFFEDTTRVLKKFYRGSDRSSFSFRSNNDVEDLLATGLYKSKVISGLQAPLVEEALRSIWASLYDYRSYVIRRYWGQQEQNLSMPIMVHPFIEGSNSHAVGSFRMNAHEQLEFDINMVQGRGERATNPSDKAKTFHFKIITDAIGVAQWAQPNKIQIEGISQVQAQALLTFVSRVQKFVKEEFLHRDYVLSAVNLEFVIESGRFFWNKPKISVLQYKPSLAKEVALGVISGSIPRDLTEKNNPSVDSQELNKELSRLGVKKMSDYDPATRQHTRYALVMKDGEPSIVFWDSGEYHQRMKVKLERLGMRWIKSGYILKSKKNELARLEFSATTIRYGVDVEMPHESSQRLFQGALTRTLNEDSLLRDFLIESKAEVSFFTSEGEGSVELDL
ncbi:MAG: hypothetical protein RJB66_97 [Pseudomonadota bacterium]